MNRKTELIKTTAMIRIASVLLTLCSLVSLNAIANITPHSPSRAAQLTSDLLDKILYEAGSKQIYQHSSETLKSNVSISDFVFIAEQLAFNYVHQSAEVLGYEHYGDEELITIHAKSDAGPITFYYSVSFEGTASKGYKLQNIRVRTDPVEKNGIYKDFKAPKPIGVGKRLNRNLALSDGSVVIIEGLTKTFIQQQNIFVYTIKYLSEVSKSDVEATKKQAKVILDEYGAEKAEFLGLKHVAMAASNISRLDDITKDIPVYRTVFVQDGDKWQSW